MTYDDANAFYDFACRVEHARIILWDLTERFFAGRSSSTTLGQYEYDLIQSTLFELNRMLYLENVSKDNTDNNNCRNLIKNTETAVNGENLYQRIVNGCKARGVAISAVEKTVGLGNGTISGWMKSTPSVATLKKVADYFGVTVDELLTDDHVDEEECSDG